MSATQRIRGRRRFGRSVVRDIREDLFERMDAATSEMAAARTRYDQERQELEQRFQQIFDTLSARQRAIAALLDDEVKTYGGRDRFTILHSNDLKLPFQDYVLNLLNASGPLSKDDIREMALHAGYGGENESVGRMLHTTLMNLTKSGKLQIEAGGKYRVVNPPLGVMLHPQSFLDALIQLREGPSSSEDEPS